MSAFTPTARSKLKRNYKRGDYDRETVYGDPATRFPTAMSAT